MTDLNATPAGNRIWLLAGLLAVVAVAGYFSLNYPPAGDDVAGTIAPAKRYQADRRRRRSWQRADWRCEWHRVDGHRRSDRGSR